MQTNTENLPDGVTLRRLPEKPTEADYARLASVGNSCNPDYPTTAQELQERDGRWDPKYFYVRFLAERDGEAVASGASGQSPWGGDLHRFWLGIHVVPTERRQGIGAVLYDALADTIAPYAPTKIGSNYREDWTDAGHFAQNRGFVEEMREWESRLDLAMFDPAPFADRRGIPAQHGVTITSLKTLQQTVPDWATRLHELEKETLLDVPRTDPFVPLPFEDFERMILQSPGFLPEGQAIAIDSKTGEWVGSSALWKRQASDWLNTGLTGVKRSHRRMGIAFALKLHVIDYAKSVGCPVVTTENATTNRGMLSINEALGFVKQPVWIVCAKRSQSVQEKE